MMKLTKKEEDEILNLCKNSIRNFTKIVLYLDNIKKPRLIVHYFTSSEINIKNKYYNKSDRFEYIIKNKDINIKCVHNKWEHGTHFKIKFNSLRNFINEFELDLNKIMYKDLIDKNKKDKEQLEKAIKDNDIERNKIEKVIDIPLEFL